MATYKAISNGNADTLGIWETWNGEAWVAASILPGASDDVYTNGFIVTVTTSQSYLSWNRSSVAAPLSITQGGQFQIDGGNDILISGEIYGTNAHQVNGSPLSACVNRLATHTGTLSIIGNQNGGSHNSTYGFYNNSTFDITSILGNQNGGSGQWAHGFFNNAAATFTSIVGNQNGGSGYQAFGFVNNSTSTFTSIVGNQNGGSGNIAYGFYNVAAATFTNPIVGNQTASTTSCAFYNVIDNLNIPFQGNAYASNVAAIYNREATTTIIYTGNIYNALSVMAIRSDRLLLNVTPTTVWEFSDIGGHTQYLYGARVSTGYPIEADVRKDIVYGSNDEFTGTLAVPPPESVVKNVPTDDTVGSLPIAQVVEEVDMELIKTKLQAIQEDTTNMPENVTTQLKQDVLGQRLSKVATLEELMGILTSLLK